MANTTVAITPYTNPGPQFSTPTLAISLGVVVPPYDNPGPDLPVMHINRAFGAVVAALASSSSLSPSSPFALLRNALTMADAAAQTPTSIQVMPGNVAALADAMLIVAAGGNLQTVLAALSDTAAFTSSNLRDQRLVLALDDFVSLSSASSNQMPTLLLALASTAAEIPTTFQIMPANLLGLNATSLLTSAGGTAQTASAALADAAAFASSSTQDRRLVAALSDAADLSASAFNQLLTPLLALANTATETLTTFQIMPANLIGVNATSLVLSANSNAVTASAALADAAAFSSSNINASTLISALADAASFSALSPFQQMLNPISITVHVDEQVLTHLKAGEVVHIATKSGITSFVLINATYERIDMKGIVQMTIELGPIANPTLNPFTFTRRMH